MHPAPRRPRAVFVLVLAALSLAAASPAAAQAPVPPGKVELRVLDDTVPLPPAKTAAGDPAPRYRLTADSIDLFAGDAYWLGLQCRAADDALRAQLGFEEEGGLIVSEVAPEGPAAAAGIELHDVLVRALGFTLREPGDLARLVGLARDGRPIAFTVLRRGARLEVEATAARRPREMVRFTSDGKLAPLVDWVFENRVGSGSKSMVLMPRVDGGSPDAGKARVRLDVLHPGVVWEDVPAALPDDVEVEVRKRGSGPASIVVRRGEDSWTCRDGKLSEVPEDLRPAVRRFLSLELPFVAAPRSDGKGIAGEYRSTAAAPVAPPPAAAGSAFLEKRLDSLERALHDLRAAVKGLEPKAPESKESQSKEPEESR